MQRQLQIETSIRILLDNQSPSGAFVACPNFETYHYSWLRDGTFIAHALDTYGEHEAAANFYRWVHRAIEGQRDRLERLLEKRRRGETPEPKEYLPARYKLDGSVEADEWPNFQLDGYGAWLWGLHRHAELSGDDALVREVEASIESCYAYLSACWHVPNYDCWEEFGDRVHGSTLACLYGGAAAMADRLGDPRWGALAVEIGTHARTAGVEDGRFVKSIGHGNVDASLLWLAVPFGVVDPLDETMRRTVAVIEAKLNHGGGVHRYPEDTYYGGGEWLLLSCWLGWYYAAAGDRERALAQLEWTERQANADGTMPEQVLGHVNVPAKIEEWRRLWGDVANPLLWSHAMYLVLAQALGLDREEGGSAG